MWFKEVSYASKDSVILLTDDGYYSLINKDEIDSNELIECGRMQCAEAYMKFMPYDDFKIPTNKEKDEILKALKKANVRIFYGNGYLPRKTELALDNYFDKFKKEFPWGDAFDSAYDLQDEESNKKVTKIINKCIEENKTVEELNDKHV